MNFDEFVGSLIREDLCYRYKNKFKNKYIAYMEEERLEEEQFRLERRIEDLDFISNYNESWDMDWFFVGSEIESFYTDLELDFSKLSSLKPIKWSSEYDRTYKDYVIQDIWKELEKIDDDVKYCYGIYSFTKLLDNNTKQKSLKRNFQILLSEIMKFKTEELVASEKVLSKYLKEKNGIETLFGNITIDISISDNKLGQGGNGIVYAGKLGKTDVAVKFLINYSTKKLERFKAEYINVNMVRDNLRNTVNYIHYEVLKIGAIDIPIIVMKKYVESLKKRRSKIEEFKWEDVIKLFLDLAKSIKTLENNKIIHRDLKPENILINDNGEYIITDFGIAHFESELYPIKDLTKKGERLANFEFAAPEQINGKEITYATDLYAFGQIIYWYVFGEVNRGTRGCNFQEKFIQEKDATWLNQIVYKCLSNNSKDRFQNIQEIEKYYSELQVKYRDINVYNDMYELSKVVRSVLPECYHNVYMTENRTYISNLIKMLTTTKFNRSLTYNTGIAHNQIEEFYEIENGNFILNTREIIIKRIWTLFGDSCYNDILILEIENPKLYVVDGEMCSAIAVINKEITVAHDKIRSGYYRDTNGTVVNTDELVIEERFIYDETDKYLAIGTSQQCSIIPKNDDNIEELQKNPELSKDIIIKLRNAISKNKTYEVLLGI